MSTIATATAQAEQRVLVVDRSRLEAAWLASFLRGAGLTAFHASAEQLDDVAVAVKPNVLVIDGRLMDEETASRVERIGADRTIVLTDGVGTAGARVRRSITMSRRHHPEDLIALVHRADLSAAPNDVTYAAVDPDEHAASRLQQLTDREMDVLRALLRGAVTQRLAEGLGISPNTLRTHVQNVFGKLGVHSRLEAVAMALRAGVRTDFSDGPPLRVSVED